MKKSIYSGQHKKLLELLKKIRKDAGYTQVQLAEKLNKPQSFVSKYESGERRLDLVELNNLCLLLKIPLVDFVGMFTS